MDVLEIVARLEGNREIVGVFHKDIGIRAVRIDARIVYGKK